MSKHIHSSRFEKLLKLMGQWIKDNDNEKEKEKKETRIEQICQTIINPISMAVSC